MPKQAVIRYFIAGTFLVFYIALFIVLFNGMKDPDALIASAQSLYEQYGILLIFGTSVLEGIFLVGSYVPGTAVILFSAAFAKTGAVSLPMVILSGAGGLVCGYSISYILGKYGWYQVLATFGLLNRLEKTKKTLETYETRTLFFGFLSTFVAALLSTSAGILRLSFKKFFLTALIAQFFWTTLWASITYFFGEFVVQIVLRYFVLIVILVLIVWGARRLLRKH